MIRARSEATPCPAVIPSARGRRVSFAEDARPQPTAADDTENIDFTTELRAQMRAAKPRRRASVMGRGATFNPGLDIWQDVAQEERERTAVAADEGRARARRASILERPAMRAPVLARKVAEAAVPRYDQTQTIQTAPHDQLRYAQGPSSSYRTSLMARPARPRRMSGIMETQAHSRRTSITGAVHLPVLEEQERPHPLAQSAHLRKDARRRTIYVPSDDTTIATIHPGAQTYVPDDTWHRPKPHDTGLDLVTVSEEEPEHTQAVPQGRRRPRMSLAAKPRKMPLQQSLNQGPNAAFAEDVIGEGGGKENIPPGMEKVVKLDVKSGPTDIVIHFEDAKDSKVQTWSVQSKTMRHTGRASTSQHAKPNLATQHSKPGAGTKRAGSSSLLEISPAKAVKSQHAATNKSRPKSALKTWTTSAANWHRDSRYNQADSTTCHVDVHGALHARSTAGEVTYQAPIVAEDLVRPALYEEHWLSHQEIAISQVLNELLSRNRKDGHATSDGSLRRGLLRLYQDSDTATLVKRLQASLQYGALAIPVDVLPKVARLESDIGLRRSFLDLWLNTYDHIMLKAALEVVIGREVVLPKRLSGSWQPTSDHELKLRLMRRGIERYLQAFLINHEDTTKASSTTGSIASIARHVESRGHENGSQAWKWRRTMIRSLMLIHLLDRAKSARSSSARLFQISSTHKSSVKVLQALSVMLLPSVGDITRPLNHLHYQLSVIQYPLEEYEYNIQNIATDLRDGMLLARIVELLYFKPKPAATTTDATMTVALPTGKILESLLHDEASNAWLLSQHLKLPCLSRAQKLYNVHVSLSALKGLNKATARLAANVTAEEVVDGHREKTMGLLWGLVGQAGIGLIIDEASLEKELRMFGGQPTLPAANALESTDILSNEDANHPKSQAKLLLQWAAAVGRRHGVTVSNLTTSFADGRAMEAIVDEYTQFIPNTAFSTSSSSTNGTPSTSGKSLAAKLKAIGCSSSFVALFAPGTGASTYPFSRSFSLLSLSYLASRLLPLTVAHRAALVLQRWYRVRRDRRNVGRRLQLLRLAHDCATVVNTRNTVIGAATTIQRAWKRLRARRLDVLSRTITTVQACIRGWKCRQILRNQSRFGGSVRPRAGW